MLHCFVSGFSCLTQKTQKNSSKFWVLPAAASVKKILPLRSRVAIPWVQRFGHYVPCQVWWLQLQVRLLATLGQELPVLQRPWQGLSGTVLSLRDHELAPSGDHAPHQPTGLVSTAPGVAV